MNNEQRSMHFLKENGPVSGKGWMFHLTGILVLGFIIAAVSTTGVLDNATPDAIRDQVLAWGSWGPLAYVILFTFVPLTLFPDAVLAIASGMAFGMGKGFILTWMGAMMGGSLAFWLARLIGQEAMEKLMNRLGHKPHGVPMMTGFIGILLLRLIPLVPFDVISYGAGLSHVRYRDFLTATALGIIPGVCVYVNVGDKLFDCNSSHFYWAITFLVGLTFLSTVGVRALKKHHQDKINEEAK